MLIYVIFLLFACLGLYFAELIRQKSRIMYAVVSLLSLFPLVFISAVRDRDIGIDVNVYGYNTFLLALQAESLLEALSKSSCEFVFVFINYVSANITDNYNVALGLLQFVILLFALLAANRLRDRIPVWFSFFVFLCGFYNLSFNLMRQCLAISFLCWLYADLLKTGNIKKFFLLGLLTFFFHKTALLIVLVLTGIHILSMQKTIIKIYGAIFMILGCIVLFFSVGYVLQEVTVMGKSYASYTGQDGLFKSVVNKMFVLSDFLCLIICALATKYSNIEKKYLYIFFLIIVFDTMCQLMGVYTAFITRLAMYTMGLYGFFLYPIVKSLQVSSKTKYLVFLLLFTVYGYIWKHMLINTGNTMIYKSEILGIL